MVTLSLPAPTWCPRVSPRCVLTRPESSVGQQGAVRGLPPAQSPVAPCSPALTAALGPAQTAPASASTSPARLTVPDDWSVATPVLLSVALSVLPALRDVPWAVLMASVKLAVGTSAPGVWRNVAGGVNTANVPRSAAQTAAGPGVRRNVIRRLHVVITVRLLVENAASVSSARLPPITTPRVT